MTGMSRTVLAMLAVTVVAAAAGGWLGVRYGAGTAHGTENLDQLLHHELKLTADQQQRLAALEADFAARRAALEGRMRAANRELAAAILSQHRYGPDAEQAIQHFHEAMQSLQEETIRHVFAMRAVLTPEQDRQFDEAVARSLSPDQT